MSDPSTPSTPSTPSSATYTLHQFPEKVAVLRMPPGTDVPPWAESSSVFAITATATETAVVCAGRSVPTKVPGDRGLLAFVLADAEPTSGVLVELLTPLAEEGVDVHVLTTHATVWVLVPAPAAERAAEGWRRRGHTVVPAPTGQPG